MKILRIMADPLIPENDKSGYLKRIDTSITPLFGGEASGEKTHQAKESLEDYFNRVIKAHRS